MNELVKSIKPLMFECIIKWSVKINKIVFGDIKGSFDMCLKTENCYLKIFVEICVGEKVWKCVKYCFKIENCYLKTQTKYLHAFVHTFSPICIFTNVFK